MDDERKTGVVVNLRQHLSGKNRPFIYPLDRPHELRITGWTEAGMIRDALAAGYVITRVMLRSWVRKGLIPPPRR